MAGVWRGAFTCVGWQVTLCDSIWQVTSRSSEMGFPGRAISAFTFLAVCAGTMCYYHFWFLADRTAARSIIGYCHYAVNFLSLTVSVGFVLRI